MKTLLFILSLVLIFSAFEVSICQEAVVPECPDEYYFNSTCNKCVRCQWDVIDPPNDATHHWCRCNCYQTGQFNLRTDLCFLQGMNWAPPPTGHQECIWRCKGKESTSKNGTFSSTDAYLATCNSPIPQCHPTCYHCLPGLASEDSCTECPVGYKLSALPAGKCIKDYDSVTNTGQCGGDPSCGDFTCPNNLIKLEGVDYLPGKAEYCCADPFSEIFLCGLYIGDCPTGYVQNPATYWKDLSYAQMTVDNCCIKTCGSTAFSCDSGYILNSSALNLSPASNSLCCQPSCSAQNICPSDYNWLSTSTVLPVNVANCCQQKCGSSTFSCNTGYSKITSMLSITTVDNAHCCQQTCALFNCPAGYNSINPTSTTMTQDSCCQATCSSFSCNQYYVPNPANSASTTVTNANCCLQTCKLYNCPVGFNKINLGSTIFTQASCCQATCASFTCPSGYSAINSTSTTVHQDNCCSLIPTCGNSFICPTGYSAINSGSTTVNQATCCQLISTCGNSFTCPTGYSAINFGSTTINQATCCQQLCGATSFSCNDGTVLDTTKLTSVASQSTCCLPTCLNYNCPSGFDPKFENQDSYPASTDLCCQQIIQVITCASVLGTCNGTDVMVNPGADYVSYAQCCQPQSCPVDQYMKNGTCVPCQWDIINPPNDAIYNWCRCNCYAPGTTVLNSGVCWVFGNGPQKPPIQECKWVCTGNEATSTNGTMTITTWVDQCNLTPQCDSNCYTCKKTNAKFCTSCEYPQTLINGQCFCANGKLSHYGVC